MAAQKKKMRMKAKNVSAKKKMKEEEKIKAEIRKLKEIINNRRRRKWRQEKRERNGSISRKSAE